MDFGLPLRSSPKPIASPTHNPVQQNFRRWARVSFRKWAKVSCQTHHLHNLHKLKGLQGIRWGSGLLLGFRLEVHWKLPRFTFGDCLGTAPSNLAYQTPGCVRSHSTGGLRGSSSFPCGTQFHCRSKPRSTPAAAIYTLTGSARLNGLDPEFYLRHVLERIAGTPLPHRRTPALEPPRPLRSSHRYPLLNRWTLRNRGHLARRRHPLVNGASADAYLVRGFLAQQKKLPNGRGAFLLHEKANVMEFVSSR